MTSTIAAVEVVPVAGHDSMLLNLSGTHGPYFTRNIAIVTDSDGRTGLGEVPGGEAIRQTIDDAGGLLVGQPVVRYRSLLRDVASRFADRDAGGRGRQTFDLRTTVYAVTALESCLLDLAGQPQGVPVAELLGEGQQRERVPMLGYLFYVGDPNVTDLPYLREHDGADEWEKARREAALTPEAVVRLGGGGAGAVRVRGLQSQGRRARRRGGGRGGHRPCAPVPRRPHHARPLRRVAPRGRRRAVPRPGRRHRLRRGPVRRRGRLLRPRGDGGVQACHGTADRHQHDRHRLAAAGRRRTHGRRRHPAGRPPFWTMAGSVRVAQLCHDFGLTWGSHSNNHFDISLAMFTHVGAAAPGEITALDTHWIWQDGQGLTTEPLRISGGEIAVPTTGGLGIELDRDRLADAHKLYVEHGLGARDDAAAMQYLVPGWTFDPKRPCLVR